MAREWGEHQPDGTVKVYRRDDNGTVTMVRQESYAQNQGQTGASADRDDDRTGTGWAALNWTQSIADRNAMMAYNNALLEFQKVQFASLSEYQKRVLAREEALQEWNKSFQESKLTFEKDVAFKRLDQDFRVHQDTLRFNQDKMQLDEQFRQRQLELQKQLADDNNALQRELQEGRFGHEIAMLTRSQDWQAREADKQRSWQTGEAQKNRELQALDVFSRMRGPKDAFTAEAMRMGLNAQGLSRSVDAVVGRFTPPSIQAEQRAPAAFNLDEAMAGFREATAEPPRMTFTPPRQRMPGADQPPAPPVGFAT